MRSPRSGAVEAWRGRRACRCRTTTNGGNRSRSRRSSASYWKVPSKPRAQIPRLATVAFAERLNEGRASETRELVQGPLMADPLMDVESERTKDREERLWIEALGREFASLLDRAVCEEDCSGRHPAPGEVGGCRRSEPLERVAVAEGRVEPMRDSLPAELAGAEGGDEGMLRARGGVPIADRDRFRAVHPVGRERGEAVADPRLLAHRAGGRQPLRPPRFGVGERIAAVVRGVEVVQ